eukprot:UN3764
MSQVATQVLDIAPRLRDKAAFTDLPQISGAFAKLGMRHRKLMACIATRLAPLLAQMYHWNLCIVAWSYDTLDTEGRFEDFRLQVWSEVARRGIAPSEVESSQLGAAAWQMKR